VVASGSWQTKQVYTSGRVDGREGIVRLPVPLSSRTTRWHTWSAADCSGLSSGGMDDCSGRLSRW